jgi:hypothetical protein
MLGAWFFRFGKGCVCWLLQFELICFVLWDDCTVFVVGCCPISKWCCPSQGSWGPCSGYTQWTLWNPCAYCSISGASPSLLIYVCMPTLELPSICRWERKILLLHSYSGMLKLGSTVAMCMTTLSIYILSDFFVGGLIRDMALIIWWFRQGTIILLLHLLRYEMLWNSSMVSFFPELCR